MTMVTHDTGPLHQDALDLGLSAFEQAAVQPDAGGELPASPAAEAGLWLGRVWGHREGYACVCLGHEGHYPQGGAYTFRRFEERFYRWPAERARVLKLLATAASRVDVFAGVLLRSSRSRKAGTALPGLVCWADVDGDWTPERTAALDQLRAAGVTTWQVLSGSGGRHVYLPLAEPDSPERIESWNRRLGVLLAADAGWSENKVLRPAGTLNHKARGRGAASTPVRWGR
jgi:hypothetical protein